MTKVRQAFALISNFHFANIEIFISQILK